MGAVWQDDTGPFFTFELLIAAGGLRSFIRSKAAAALLVACLSFWACFGLFHWNAVHSVVGAQFAGISLAFVLFLGFGGFAERQFNVSPSLLSVVAANGMLYFAFAYLLLRVQYDEWLGLLAIGVSGSYLGCTAWLRKMRPDSQEVVSTPTLLALGMAATFVVLAVPIQFAGYGIPMAWAVQAAVLTWVGMRLKSRHSLLFGAAVFGLVAIRLFFWDGWLYSPGDSSGRLLLNARFATYAVCAAAAFLVSRWEELRPSAGPRAIPSPARCGKATG